MRQSILLIAFMIGLSAAQFEQAEEERLLCEKSCCSANGGQWDALMQACDIDSTSPAFNAYTACDNACVEEAGREIKGAGSYGSPCCAPAFLIFAIIGSILIKD